jgi:hypothetical protein
MKTVFARILQKNNNQYFDCVHKEHINAGDGTITEGIYWFIPKIRKGRLVNYTPVISAVKPTQDSVKAIRVRDTLSNTVYFAALLDAAAATDFSDIANGCCGAANAMPDVVVPDVLLEEDGCGNAVDGYLYFDVPPALQAGETYIAFGSAGGAAFAPVWDAAGFDSLAAFKAWANANWNGYGVFDVLNATKVTFVSATQTTGFVKLVRAKYFESGVPAAVGAGTHYVGNAVIDGVAMPQVVAANNAALSTLATALNANATWAAYGKYSVVGGKIRLVSRTAQTAVITITVA